MSLVVFSFYLISVSLAVVVGVGCRRGCLLLHDFYDYRGDLRENSERIGNISHQYSKRYKPNC